MQTFTADRLGLDIAEVDAQIDGRWSLPAHTYFDPDVYEFELGAVFSARWQYFAPLERLAEPGSVVTGDIGALPVVVTRDEDGELHGFFNVCRHRGYRVVAGDRNGRWLQCGYHGWTYRLDGSLARSPGTEDDPSFCAGEMSLLPVAVDQWAQGVYVNPDPDACTLREAHPLLEGLAVDRGFDTDPSHYRFHREIVTENAANWKLWYDNGVECYHCPHIHGSTFADAYDVGPESGYRWDTHGTMSSSHFEPSERVDDGTLRSSTYCSFQFFPGAHAVQQDDFMYMARVVPTGPESCLFVCHYFAEVGADLDRVARWIDIWDATFNEDAEAVAVQQRNLRTGRLPRMRYVDQREGPVLFFNRLIWEAYKEALGASS